MPTVRLATFDSFGLARTGKGAADADERLVLQALALRETNADLIALQAVPDMATLDGFRASMAELVGRRYREALLLEGNDAITGSPAVLGDLAVVQARSHRTLTFEAIGRLPPPDLEPTAAVFARDCLEATIEQEGQRLTLFVCHFTDPPPGPAALEAEEPARQRRLAEAAAVRWIIEQRFAAPDRSEWVVLGNLSDQATETDGTPIANHGLGPLLARGFAVDLAEHGTNLPPERWTRFAPDTGRYLRHDHLLLSPALARRNQDSRVRIIRAGLPHRAERHVGPRYPRIGWLEPAASWSCPMVVELAFAGEAATKTGRRSDSPGGGRPGRASMRGRWPKAAFAEQPAG